MTLTNHMPLCTPRLLGMSTIVVHTNDSGMCLSWNSTFVIPTILSQFSVFGSFSLVASHSHVFGCSAPMHNNITAHPTRGFCTENAISSPYGCPSAILTACTIIGIGYTYGWRHL